MTVTPMFTCPDCGATSLHPRDLAESYCGRCCEFKVCALCSARNVKVTDGLCRSCCDMCAEWEGPAT